MSYQIQRFDMTDAERAKFSRALTLANLEQGGTWQLEGTTVLRQFSGAYGIDEIRALLIDMVSAQTAFDRLSR